MIVGITGRKRSGKSTAAVVFEQQGYRLYALAGPIKEACRVLFGWTEERIEHGKETVDDRWGLSPRRAMQLLGTEVFREWMPTQVTGFPGSFWVQRMAAAYEDEMFRGAGLMVVPDVRFPDEARAIQSLGGLVLRIERGDLPTDDHASEQQVDAVVEDGRLWNDGSVTDLWAGVTAWAVENSLF